MVGRWVSFWDCLFLGAMLNFWGVILNLCLLCVIHLPRGLGFHTGTCLVPFLHASRGGGDRFESRFAEDAYGSSDTELGVQASKNCKAQFMVMNMLTNYHHPEDPMELVYIKPQVFGMCIFMVVSNMFYFHPYLGKMNPFWRAYFSDGLKPPTWTACKFMVMNLFEYHYP